MKIQKFLIFYLCLSLPNLRRLFGERSRPISHELMPFVLVRAQSTLKMKIIFFFSFFRFFFFFAHSPLYIHFLVPVNSFDKLIRLKFEVDFN